MFWDKLLAMWILRCDVCLRFGLRNQVRTIFTLTKITSIYPEIDLGYKYGISPPPIFLFSSSALFAFWLRSSVVSVLFSLISEIFLREKSMIKFIFVRCEGSSRLAYDSLHCVPGLTLPPGDANPFSSMSSACLGS